MIEVSRGELTAPDTLQTHIRACKSLEIMLNATNYSYFYFIECFPTSNRPDSWYKHLFQGFGCLHGYSQNAERCREKKKVTIVSLAHLLVIPVDTDASGV